MDPFDFVLAEALGMTVAEMRDRVSNQEWQQWSAFHSWRARERELAIKRAQQR